MNLKRLPFTVLATLLVAAPLHAQEAEAEGEAEGSASVGYGSAQLESSTAEVSAPRDFGRAGVFAVGVERLFGFAKTSGKVTIDEGTVKTERELENTSFYFLGGNSQSETDSFAGPYVVPRLGLDYFVVDRVSVGAAFTYASDSGKFDETVSGQNNRNQYDVSQTSILIAPRAGYAYMFSESVGIWPRAGVSYVTIKSVQDDGQNKAESSQNMLALGVEALLVVLPVPHAGFTVGPTVDFPLVGSGKEPVVVNGQVQSRDRDTNKFTTLGLQFGALMWF